VVAVVGIVKLATNDCVEWFVFQTTGSTLSMDHNVTKPEMTEVSN
jgi:hypothetical protein